MKPIFFTSDWHCFHENSLKFDNRPFKDIHHMHESLIKRYNATVPEHGLCYFLGDMGFTQGKKLKSVIDRLNGTKILILGNHDKTMHAMYGSGFDAVLYNATIYIHNQEVTMSHCPLPGIKRENMEGMKRAVKGENWHGESRQVRFTVPNRGQFHLHGHIHSPNKGRSETILGRQMDVGVPGNDYTPRSYSYMESWIMKTLKEESGE